MGKKISTSNVGEKRKRGAQKGHPPNRGSFKKGDRRIWKNGQRNKAAVAATTSYRNSLVDVLNERMPAIDSRTGKKITRTNLEWIARKRVAMALTGDGTSIDRIEDRIDGKVVQPIGLSGNTTITVIRAVPRPRKKVKKNGSK